MKDLKVQLKQNNQKATPDKILSSFYFCGHGAMNNKNYMILNESDEKLRYFPLELQIEVFGKAFPNTCMIQYWDSCRE